MSISPGVYVENEAPPQLPASFYAGPVPLFLGLTEKAPENPAPVQIRNMEDFEHHFGGAYAESATLEIDGAGNVTNSGIAPVQPYSLYYAVSFFLSHSSDQFCYASSAGIYENTVDAVAFQNILIASKDMAEINLISPCDLTADLHSGVSPAVLQHCQQIFGRFAFLSTITGQDLGSYREGLGTEALSYGAGYYPDCRSFITRNFPDTNWQANIDAVLGKANLDLDDREASSRDAITGDVLRLQHPDIYASVKQYLAQQTAIIPANILACVSAVKAESDGDYWSTPANQELPDLAEPMDWISDLSQEDLLSPQGNKPINAVRAFKGNGIRIWGGQTLDGLSNEWRYISVRRLFLSVEKDLRRLSEFCVFEPNTIMTWTKLKAIITAYLEEIWSSGALVGTQSDEAYSVAVGLNETMTEKDVNEGVLRITVGLAPNKPAEFIYITLSHNVQS